MKITMQEFEQFEKQFVFDVLANPHYRIGQAFYNSFPEIVVNMEQDGDIGFAQASHLFHSNRREEVLKLIDWYLIK